MKRGRYVKTALIMTALFLVGAVKGMAQGPEYTEGDWYYKDDREEILRDSFMLIDGITYYFGNDGKLQSNRIIEKEGNIYGLEENGALIKNSWKKMKQADGSERCWMYFGYDGRAFTEGWLSDAGRQYHFTDGRMDHGWYTEDNGAVYYLGEEDEGYAHTGWLIWKGGDVPGAEAHAAGWYYFSESTGRMIADREIQIGGDYYAFREDGSEAAGFCKIEENGQKTEKYYDTTSGRRVNGWCYVNGDSETSEHPEGWYYFLNGIPLSQAFHTIKLSDTFGTASIDNTFYAFDISGKMLTGILNADNGKQYFFDTDGRMLTGYLCVEQNGDEKEYRYFDEQGTAPPVLGGTVTGVRGNHVYDRGIMLKAEKDCYEQVTVETTEGSRCFVVSTEGTIRKNGTVRLDNGRTARICSECGSYYLEIQK